MPAESTACPFCGQSEWDPFFFSEEDAARRRRPVMTRAPGRREPSALKPARRVDLRSVLTLTGAGLVVVGLLVLALTMSSKGAKLSFKSPDQLVAAYYEALEKGDLNTMLSLVSSGYQPTLKEKKALEKALEDNSYDVTGLKVRIMADDREDARVAIETLEVTVTPGGGGQEVRRSLSTEIIQPAREKDPNIVMLVKAQQSGGTWKLLSRPYGGWAPENIWVLGRPSRAFAGD